MHLHEKVKDQGFVQSRRMTPLSRECMLVLVVELVFVSELAKSPCDRPLQSKIKVSLEEFDGVHLPQHGTLPFL